MPGSEVLDGTAGGRTASGSTVGSQRSRELGGGSEQRSPGLRAEQGGAPIQSDPLPDQPNARATGDSLPVQGSTIRRSQSDAPATLSYLFASINLDAFEGQFRGATVSSDAVLRRGGGMAYDTPPAAVPANTRRSESSSGLFGPAAHASLPPFVADSALQQERSKSWGPDIGFGSLHHAQANDGATGLRYASAGARAANTLEPLLPLARSPPALQRQSAWGTHAEGGEAPPPAHQQSQPAWSAYSEETDVSGLLSGMPSAATSSVVAGAPITSPDGAYAPGAPRPVSGTVHPPGEPSVHEQFQALPQHQEMQSPPPSYFHGMLPSAGPPLPPEFFHHLHAAVPLSHVYLAPAYVYPGAASLHPPQHQQLYYVPSMSGSAMQSQQPPSYVQGAGQWHRALQGEREAPYYAYSTPGAPDGRSMAHFPYPSESAYPVPWASSDVSATGSHGRVQTQQRPPIPGPHAARGARHGQSRGGAGHPVGRKAYDRSTPGAEPGSAWYGPGLDTRRYDTNGTAPLDSEEPRASLPRDSIREHGEAFARSAANSHGFQAGQWALLRALVVRRFAQHRSCAPPPLTTSSVRAALDAFRIPALVSELVSRPERGRDIRSSDGRHQQPFGDTFGDVSDVSIVEGHLTSTDAEVRAVQSSSVPENALVWIPPTDRAEGRTPQSTLDGVVPSRAAPPSIVRSGIAIPLLQRIATAAMSTLVADLVARRRWKTKPCHAWARGHGVCPRGDTCDFAHGDEELRVYSVPRDARWKTRICRVFLDSCGAFCPHGDRCSFAHGVADLRIHVPSLSTSTPVGGIGGGSGQRRFRNQLCLPWLKVCPCAAFAFSNTPL